MNKRKMALLAGVMLMVSPLAHAEGLQGAYVNLGFGGNWLKGQNNVAAPAQSGLAGTTKTDVGWIGTAALGWGFGNGFRAEVQGDFRDNRLHRVGSLDARGDEQQFGGFINGYYDFNQLQPLGIPVTPYVGAGVGYEQVKFANGVAAGVYPRTPTYVRLNGTDGGFAVQGMLGVAYTIPEVPSLALTAEYRFTAIPDGLKFKSQDFRSTGVGPATYRTDNQFNHAAILGLRWSFNTPQAPVEATPVVAAPPQREAARTYLVFFDWDSADLTARARGVVAEAASASQRVATTRIGVNGYTDTSGTPVYNKRLSERRAQNVANELVRDGVAREAISIVGWGETHLLVPTANGVREPQNRRVEIVLQ